MNENCHTLLDFINELIDNKQFNHVIREYYLSKERNISNEKLKKVLESFKKYKNRLKKHIEENNPKLYDLKPYKEINNLYNFYSEHPPKGTIFLPDTSDEFSPNVKKAMIKLAEKISQDSFDF